MPRKRMIDPGIWTNEDFGRLAAFQQILYIGLISNADDEGRIKGSPQYLKAVIFPYKSCRDGEITEALEVLGKNLIKQYSVKGAHYIQHPNWLVWQKIDKPYPSKLPPPDGYSPTIPRPFADHSPLIQGGGNPKQPNTIQGKKMVCPDCKGNGEYRPGVKCLTCKGSGLAWREDVELLKKTGLLK